MRTYKLYLYEQKFNNARLLSAYFVTTEGIGNHYEGHKYAIASTCFPKSSVVFPKSSVVFALLAKNLLQRQV